MKTTLIVPESEERRILKTRRRSRLHWTTGHSASHYGLGVLLYASGDILDGNTFRALRDTLGARIETDDARKVCGALGVPHGEPGIVHVLG
jgi:hypothetical protein